MYDCTSPGGHAPTTLGRRLWDRAMSSWRPLLRNLAIDIDFLSCGEVLHRRVAIYMHVHLGSACSSDRAKTKKYSHATGLEAGCRSAPLAWMWLCQAGAGVQKKDRGTLRTRLCKLFQHMRGLDEANHRHLALGHSALVARG